MDINLSSCDLTQFTEPEDFFPRLCLSEQSDLFIGEKFYMRLFPDLSENMREQIVDWLLTTHHSIGSDIETFHTAINYFDTFMRITKGGVSVKKFQLVGCAAYCIAAKMIEVDIFPGFSFMAEKCGDAYKKHEIYDMVSPVPLSLSLCTPQSLFYYSGGVNA